MSPFRPAARRPRLRRLVPVSGRLGGYGGGALRRDLLAGVTVAALALPAAMAYGELAGLLGLRWRCCRRPSASSSSATPTRS